MTIWRGRVRWLLIAWMFVMSAIAYLDRANISVAGSSMAKEYKLDNVHLGWIFSAFVLGYALFQAPGGRIADRFGPRRVLTWAVVWWGVFTALTASIPPQLTNALAILIAVRFVLGMGEAVVYPCSNRLVANWIPSDERGVANGLIFAGVGVGAGAAPPLITYIMINHGWRWSFWASAILGTIAGVIWYLLARDTPARHPWVDRGERDRIARGLPAIQKENHIVPFRSILGSKDVWAITLSYFSYGYTAYIFFTWFFIYLSTVRGLNLKSSAYFAMLPPLTMAVCSQLGGVISDRLTKRVGKRAGRCGVASAGIALAALFLALGPQAHSAELASVILAGGAGALYLSQSSFWSVTADIAGPSAGTVSGVMNMGAQIGGTVTASLTPWIAKNFGWTESFLVAAGLCALGAIAWLLVDPAAELRTSEARVASAERATAN